MEEVMYGCVSCAEEAPMDRVKYLLIRPDPIQLPGAGYMGYGQPIAAIAAPHPDAPSVGEHNGWVSLAKKAMIDLASGATTNTTDEIDASFTDGVAEFQEEYTDLYGLRVTGWLDPKTTKAMIKVYDQVLGRVPPLVPVYLKDDSLIVGYPPAKKSNGPWKMLGAIGLTAAGVLAVGLLLGRR